MNLFFTTKKGLLHDQFNKVKKANTCNLFLNNFALIFFIHVMCIINQGQSKNLHKSLLIPTLACQRLIAHKATRPG